MIQRGRHAPDGPPLSPAAFAFQQAEEVAGAHQVVVEDSTCRLQQRPDERIAEGIADADAFLPARDDVVGPQYLLFAAPLARHIPMAILAGILMIVAYDMGEWREIPEVVKLGPAEAAVWFITFTLTVFADLTVAVEAGMVLAALLFIRRVTTTTTVARVTSEYIEHGRAHSLQLHDVPDDVAIFRIHGPFLFGATDKLVELERDLPRLPRVVILRLRNMTAIDGTGLHAFEHFADALHASGRSLILCGMRDQPARMMERAEFHEHIGEANLAPTIEAALRRARGLLREQGNLTPAS